MSRHLNHARCANQEKYSEQKEVIDDLNGRLEAALAEQTRYQQLAEDLSNVSICNRVSLSIWTRSVDFLVPVCLATKTQSPPDMQKSILYIVSQKEVKAKVEGRPGSFTLN